MTRPVGVGAVAVRGVLIAACAGLSAGGCLAPERWGRSPPSAYRADFPGLAVTSDVPLADESRLFEELVELRRELTTDLDLPESAEPVRVRLFGQPRELAAWLAPRYPDLADRRAVFVSGESQLAVYAAWSDRAAEDLRHEVVHGFLHAVVPDLPVWLDEGLAEYYEVPRPRRGDHPTHPRQLRTLAEAGQWQPDLPRLERSTSAASLTQTDYAEAWAWVAWLHGGENRALLRAYLRDLRQGPQAPPLSTRLAGKLAESNAELAAMVAELSAGERNATAAEDPGMPADP